MLILGGSEQTGAYLLHIAMRTDADFAFGRFRQGALIGVPAGEYIYVGSAMALRGAGSLGPRLVRHATRSGGQPAHAIRAPMIDALTAAGLRASASRAPKTLFWNVDYLLDRPEANLTDAIVIRTAVRLESRLARWLMRDGLAQPLAAGLGAGDAPGETHLLRLSDQYKIAANLNAWVYLHQQEVHEEVI